MLYYQIMWLGVAMGPARMARIFEPAPPTRKSLVNNAIFCQKIVIVDVGPAADDTSSVVLATDAQDVTYNFIVADTSLVLSVSLLATEVNAHIVLPGGGSANRLQV